MRYLVKQLVPPIFNTIWWFSFKYGWKGDFENFESAQKEAGGYNADHILEKIIATTQRVKDGLVPYERDGIEYDQIKMNFPLLTSLLWIASKNSGNLTVLDFGGSLGTGYFQTKPYLKGLSNLQWCIVEQENYVNAGIKHFENEELHFYYTVKECMQKHQPDIILFNGVLQYIGDAYMLLDEVRSAKIPFVYFDYTAYLDQEKDRFTIQKVPPVYYGADASYACIFFSKPKMFQWLKMHYELCYEFISDPDKYYLELMPFQYEGQLWQLK